MNVAFRYLYLKYELNFFFMEVFYKSFFVNFICPINLDNKKNYHRQEFYSHLLGKNIVELLYSKRRV